MVRGQQAGQWRTGTLPRAREKGVHTLVSISARPVYEKWLREWSDIHDHLPRLHEHAKGNCLEIGVRGGVSTSALLAGLEVHGGHLMSIDIDECGEANALLGEHPLWTFYRLDSRRDAAHIKSMLPVGLSLLVVDGDHSYAGVLMDLLNYGERADRILLHDTEAAEWPEVRYAVESYVAETERPVVWHMGSYGMAEITR